jgi:hypothetical protein
MTPEEIEQLKKDKEQLEKNYAMMVKNYHSINDEYVKYKNNCTNDCKAGHQFRRNKGWE